MGGALERRENGRRGFCDDRLKQKVNRKTIDRPRGGGTGCECLKEAEKVQKIKKGSRGRLKRHLPVSGEI